MAASSRSGAGGTVVWVLGARGPQDGSGGQLDSTPKHHQSATLALAHHLFPFAGFLYPSPEGSSSRGHISTSRAASRDADPLDDEEGDVVVGNLFDEALKQSGDKLASIPGIGVLDRQAQLLE